MSHPRRFLRLLFVVAVLMSTSVCAGFMPTAPRQSAAEYCASHLGNQYGSAFFCPTSQANLDQGPFPDGSHGYCMSAVTNLSKVGYSAYTRQGLAGGVTTSSQANTDCNNFNRAGYSCNSYIRCTRP